MWFCNDCGNLDRSRKETSNGFYRYGCNAREKYTCGWLKKDSGLNNMGCSLWMEKQVNKLQQVEKQLSLF